MKNSTIITLLVALQFVCFQLNAQFSCATAVSISDGYIAFGITTSGTGGIEDWVNSATTCGVSTSYFTSSDVYLFSYTTLTADENITMVVNSNNTSIYDRWGGQVYYTNTLSLNDHTTGWDGYDNNELAAAGAYIYFVNVILADGRQEILKGETTLVR